MKMETTIYAERAGRISEVIATVGLQVKAGDLLLRLTGWVRRSKTERDFGNPLTGKADA